MLLCFIGLDISIRDSHFNKINWEADGIEPILIGMSMQRQNDIDPFYVDDLRNHLFYSGPFNGPEIPGIDLAARSAFDLAVFRANIANSTNRYIEGSRSWHITL